MCPVSPKMIGKASCVAVFSEARCFGCQLLLVIGLRAVSSKRTVGYSLKDAVLSLMMRTLCFKSQYESFSRTSMSLLKNL